MHKKSNLRRWLSVIAVVALFAGCAQMAVKPDQQNFKTPVVSLDSMEVAHAFGYWYFSNKVQPTKGKPDNVGAPLDLAFIFNIKNPNEYPVKMNSLKFTVAFEDFDLNTVGSTDTMWIPAGKTNQVRVHAHFDVRQSLLSLMVTGGFKLKAEGTNAWAILEKWWTEIPQYNIPIHVKGGSAIFNADGMTKIATFKATFPE
ncbi:MAG: LEA type 2 family protein [Desulfobacterales bacterium]